MDTAKIIAEILKGYELNPRGFHGVVHWARVMENGLKLAGATGRGSDGRDALRALSRFAARQ